MECWIFFLITLRPPKSTLFPYTTLFRSMRFMLGTPPKVYNVVHERAHLADPVPRKGQTTRPAHRQDPSHESIGQDRKSTRLNSSHSQISYAVFCLKKKKKNKSRSQETYS